jgi:UDP-N-acetylglucosamine 2-epimerase (non-hydrolysing)
MQKIILVVGARPNFVKIAPLWRSFNQKERVQVILVHTGQHYDDVMSHDFFRDLGLPVPAYNLAVGAHSHARQTADIMIRFDEVIEWEVPDDVVVVGDVNSTVACALVAVKRGVRTSHVEAGLRSRDRTMPEEINRLATDAIADLMFVSEPSGVDNLRLEGVDVSKIYLVGNVVIDSLVYAREAIETSGVLTRVGLETEKFALVTIHRPSNVDSIKRFEEIMQWLTNLSESVSVVFPMHPRTHKQWLHATGKEKSGDGNNGRLKIISPLGYLDFQKLLKSAQFVITDSGGLQEETTWLGVPCITLRSNTERPVTVDEGTNYLVGDDMVMAGRLVQQFLAGKAKQGKAPALWDGQSAQRIVEVISGQMNR